MGSSPVTMQSAQRLRRRRAMGSSPVTMQSAQRDEEEAGDGE